MLEDSDSEVSELDISSKTWNKLEKHLQTIGFLEGAEKGKELSLQEGFNLGFSDGFELGKCLGEIKGTKCCEAELQHPSSEKFHLDIAALTDIKGETCIICANNKTTEISNDGKMDLENSDALMSAQQKHINKMIATLKSDLKDDLENG